MMAMMMEWSDDEGRRSAEAARQSMIKGRRRRGADAGCVRVCTLLCGGGGVQCGRSVVVRQR